MNTPTHVPDVRSTIGIHGATVHDIGCHSDENNTWIDVGRAYTIHIGSREAEGKRLAEIVTIGAKLIALAEARLAELEIPSTFPTKLSDIAVRV